MILPTFNIFVALGNHWHVGENLTYSWHNILRSSHFFWKLEDLKVELREKKSWISFDFTTLKQFAIFGAYVELFLDLFSEIGLIALKVSSA